MSSKAITDKPDPTRPREGWEAAKESAPSQTRVDEPALGRVVGFVGLMCLALGGTALLLHRAGIARGIGPTWGAIFAIGGVACLLFHAFCDNDVQVRRIYGLVGFLWLASGAILTVLPLPGLPAGSLFIPYGYVCGILALFFLMPFSRHETEPNYLRYVKHMLLGAGAALAVVGFVGGNISEWFLSPYGILLALLGLAYLWGYLSIEGVSSEQGYRVGRLMALVGTVVLVVALGRTFLPQLFHAFGWTTGRPAPYFMPFGLSLTLLGVLYLSLGVGLLSDRRLIVMMRRELGAYFFSPIAYLVLLGVTAVGWLQYWFLISTLYSDFVEGKVMIEPIVSRYFLAWGPVICVILVVPVLTMRLLSEEKRSGTLEVLLTAPVDEFSVVLSKFLAVWVFFMMLWVPWGLLLLGLRLETGQAFEYRPIVNFYLILACTGAGFLAIGMFFSALTDNQLIAAVLTVAVMIIYLMAFLARSIFRPTPGAPESFWSTVLTHVSFIDLWISALEQGTLNPKHLLYHLSAAVFGVFLTVKVLEARRWL